MRILFKILKILLLIIIVLIAAALSYLYGVLPKKEKPKDIRIELTPARLERGAYLAHHVNVCVHCHSERKFEYFATPYVPGTEGQGEVFVKNDQLGELYSPNITPYKLSNWTDGEIMRAVTSGVNKDGGPLFPIMPYEVYANLKEEDLYSVIAYVRSLKSVAHDVPETHLKFPLFLIVRLIPGPPKPNLKAQEDPGHYLATIAGCLNCHTPTNDQKQPLWDKMGSGGQDFDFVKSANITPDAETGIGIWSKQDFIEKFKKWQQPELRQVVTPEKKNTVMPWIEFSGMKEDDLGAIYDFLRTIPPIRNKVEKWSK